MRTTTTSIFDELRNLRTRGALACLLLGALTIAGCASGDRADDTDAGIASASSAAGSAGTVAMPANGGAAGRAPQQQNRGASGADAGVTPPPANQTCTVGAQCASGFCVDGVCCDTACDGACQSCAQTGKVGTCSTVKNATDDTCTGSSICDASGSCGEVLGKSCASSKDCASGSCVDGVCCGSAACGGCQSCARPGAEGTCTIVPRFTDDPDSDCSGPNTCDGLGGCRFKNGTRCEDDGQCTSLHCVDRICCNEACSGTGFSCDQVGSVGTCLPLDKVKDGEPCTSDADCLGGSCITSYRDADGDGYGHDKVTRCERAPAAGYVTVGGDCCDADAATHPGVTAYASVANACGGFDRNCDGKVERQDGSSAACGCITVGGKLGGPVCIACR